MGASGKQRVSDLICKIIQNRKYLTYNKLRACQQEVALP